MPKAEIVERGGQMFVRIGDCEYPIKGFRDGAPVVACEAEEIRRPDGGQDVMIRPPALSIAATGKEPGGNG